MSPNLLAQLQQPYHLYSVETRDGFILDLYRLLPSSVSSIHPSTLKSKRELTKPVLLWHGLSTNHEIFISSKRHDSLGTYLHDRECDVWLANSRGNKHTRHSTLDPSQSQYWQFSLTEYAIDVEAVVSFILQQTRQSSLTFIGFSQGSAIGIAALSLFDELNVKIHQFIGLAPNMKPRKWENDWLHAFIERVSPDGLFSVFGKKSFLPIASVVSDHFPAFMTKNIIYSVINSALGWKLDNYGDYARQNELYKHIFGLTSVQSFVHWFQIMRDGRFQHFKESSGGDSLPVLYPVNHITTNLSLYCGELDNICDVKFLQAQLPPHTKVTVVKDYEHLDLIWHEHAHLPDQVWDDIYGEIKDSAAFVPISSTNTIANKMSKEQENRKVEQKKRKRSNTGSVTFAAAAARE